MWLARTLFLPAGRSRTDGRAAPAPLHRSVPIEHELCQGNVVPIDREHTELGLDLDLPGLRQTEEITAQDTLILEWTLAGQRLTNLDLGELPREASRVLGRIESALDSRRTDVEPVFRTNHVERVERRREIARHVGADVDGDASARRLRVGTLDRQLEHHAAMIRLPNELDSIHAMRGEHGFDDRNQAICVESWKFGEGDGHGEREIEIVG